MSQYQSIPKFISGAMRNKFRNTIVYRNLFWSIWGYGKGRKGSMFVYIGGDSSPASAHGSPLKRTRTESVSTDLYALSRGFIPGGIVITSGMKTRFIIGYRNPAYKQVGIPIPQISLSVREAVSKRRNGFMSVYIGGESSPASAHGSPLKWTRLESVSTDLYALSRGFIPGGIMALSAMETRPAYCCCWSHWLSFFMLEPGPYS